jgi:hypothetical protein
LSGLEYKIDIRDKRIQEIVAERLERGIHDGSIAGEDAVKAQRIIVRTVQQLLARKRLPPVEVARLRLRWSEYLEPKNKRRNDRAVERTNS